jgi:hypothetical protein
MKFIFADSLDMIDPGYDFVGDRHSAGRDGYWTDRYPHEVLDQVPYDGILVSRGIVGDHRFPGRYTPAQAMRFRRIGAREYLRLSGPKFRQHLLFGDCGAFSYLAMEEPPYQPEEILDFYADGQFSHGCSVDHVILDFDKELKGLEGGSQDARRRFEITLSNAEIFLPASKALGSGFTPLGVVQGWSPGSMAEAARSLEAMGYTYLALGGMVPLRATAIHAVLQAVREVIAPATRLHLLGFAKAEQIGEFTGYGIESFDSTSPLLRAFKDARANYYFPTEDGLEYYSAIRIPQATENPRLLRAVKEGRCNQEALVILEQTALAAVRGFDRGTVGLDEAIDAVASYNDIFGSDVQDSQVVAQNRRTRTRLELRRTLEAAPWKHCPCAICRDVSIDVMIFRSSNRNKRRGFHNLGVFYEHFQNHLNRRIPLDDLQLPGCYSPAESAA